MMNNEQILIHILIFNRSAFYPIHSVRQKGFFFRKPFKVFYASKNIFLSISIYLATWFPICPLCIKRFCIQQYTNTIYMPREINTFLTIFELHRKN